MSANVVSVNISVEKGTPKEPVPEIRLDERGVQGDAHAGHWHRQVSILSRELIDGFQGDMDRTLGNGEFAENITTRGLDLSTLGLMDRLTIGEVVLQVTQIGKKCHGDSCAIFREIGKCVMPKEGIFCSVVRGGVVRPDDVLTHQPRSLKVSILTASDRASRGEYEDHSGPQVEALLTEFFATQRWHPEINRQILPDEGSALTGALEAIERDGGDIVIITGGTGIGPRDITPEAVHDFCEKTIPGIMDAIRLKYGADKPNALLSRSVAGVKGTMLVYAIPGSVRAVREYMSEIFKTMGHALFMLHAVDAHTPA
jgi:molybdopterin adenylyltransferase